MVVCLLAARDVNIQLVLLLSINLLYLYGLVTMKPYVSVSISDKPSRLDPLKHLEMMLTVILILILTLFLVSFNFSLLSTDAASLTSIVIMFLVPLTGVSILIAKSHSQRSRDEGDGEMEESKADMFRCRHCMESFEDVEVVGSKATNNGGDHENKCAVEDEEKGHEEKAQDDKSEQQRTDDVSEASLKLTNLFIGFPPSSSQDEMVWSHQEKLACQVLLHKVLIHDIQHVVSLIKPYLNDYEAAHTNSFIPTSPPQIEPNTGTMSSADYNRVHIYEWNSIICESIPQPPYGDEEKVPGSPPRDRQRMAAPKGLCDWCSLHHRERSFKKEWINWLREWRKRDAVCGTTSAVGNILYNCLVSVPGSEKVVVHFWRKYYCYDSMFLEV